MEPRVDVHMLTMNESPAWREACVDSLQGAPIILHTIPGIPGALGQARTAGYLMGTLDLVSFVDPDDLYEPQAFTQLVDALDANPNATLAYTNETLMDSDGKQIGLRELNYDATTHRTDASHVHGLIVMRRSAVQHVLDNTDNTHQRLKSFADWMMTLLVAKQGEVIHLPIVGRHWRQHAKQTHNAIDQVDIRLINKVLNLYM